MEKFVINLKENNEIDLSNTHIKLLDEKIFNEYKNLDVLYLSNNQIKTLDKTIFNELKYLTGLYLSNNQLESLDKTIFNQLKNLTGLFLSNNQLESLDKKLFCQLKCLKRLDLSNNKLKSIDGEIFDELENLNWLYLTNNCLEYIAKEIFSSLKNLSWLYLSNNKIQSLDSKIFDKLKKLEKLDLSSNKINQFDQALFDELKNLTDLNLSHNQIKSLDRAIFRRLKSLNMLHLNNNQIKSLDKTIFNQLKNLNALYLSNNQLEYLEKTIFNELNNLTGLYLSNNQLESLDKMIFCQLKCLQRLDLSNNKLKSIDREIFNELNNLTILNLSNNILKYLDKVIFSKLENLFGLYLNNNLIDALDTTLFNCLINLTELNLSYNCIGYVGKEIFNQLKNLNWLYLNNNRIQTLDKTIFCELINLSWLYLNDNQIQSFDQTLFNELKNLSLLYLNNNQIQSIHKNLFKQLINLTVLDLSNNQIQSLDKLTFYQLTNLERCVLSNNLIQLLDIDLFNNNINLYWIDFRKNIVLNNEYLFKNFLNLLTTKGQDISNVFRYKEYEMYYKPSLILLPKKDNYNLLIRNFHNSTFLFAFFMHKTIHSTNDIEDKSKKDSFKSIFNLLENYEITLFDFFILCSYDSSSILIFMNFLHDLIKQDCSISNLEWKLNSGSSFYKICEFNDVYLFETIFGQDSSNVEFIFDKKCFFFSIDYCKCFETIYDNKNEKLAIHFFQVVKSVFEQFQINNQNIREHIYLYKFNEKFLSDYLEKIFEDFLITNNQQWYNLINSLMDFSLDESEPEFLNEKFIFTDTYIFHKCLQRDIKKMSFFEQFKTLLKFDSKVIPEDQKKYGECSEIIIDDFNKTNNDYSEENFKKNINEYDQSHKNILYWINLSKNQELLLHPTTLKLVEVRYKYIPRFIYFLNLFAFLLFLIFYSISMFNVDESTKLSSNIISLVLLFYFLILEISQIIYFLKKLTILIYIFDFKNFIELIGFPFCITSLCLTFANKSMDLIASFNSITILIVYCIFIMRLNKTFIGPYVNVFGKIIRKSISLFAIILIVLIAFVISFQNRSYYYYKLSTSNNSNQEITNENSFSQFNGNFENNLYKLLAYLLGNIDLDGMGIEFLDKSSLINFIIYGVFIFLMPILFINIFTGISIDEIQNLIKNAKSEIVSNKIDYVLNESIILIEKKIVIIEYILKSIESLLKWLNEKLKSINLVNEYVNKYNEYKKERSQSNKEVDLVQKILQLENNMNNILRLINDSVKNEDSLKSDMQNLKSELHKIEKNLLFKMDECNSGGLQN